MSVHVLRRPKASLTRAAAFSLALIALPGLVIGAPGKGPDSVADVAERVMDAVVNISTSQNIETARNRQTPPQAQPQLPPGSPFEEFFEEFFKRRGEEPRNQPRRVSSLGSGFVVDPSGIIVTNNHVIDERRRNHRQFRRRHASSRPRSSAATPRPISRCCR